MYLYLGQDEIILDERVIGVFDMDMCSAGKRTREYLRKAEESGAVLDASGELPRSFIVATHPYHEQIVYLSQRSSWAIRNQWREMVDEKRVL